MSFEEKQRSPTLATKANAKYYEVRPGTDPKVVDPVTKYPGHHNYEERPESEPAHPTQQKEYHNSTW